MKDLIAGIDIGGTKIAIAVAEPNGEVIAKGRFATELERGPEWIVKDCCDRLRTMAAEHNGVIRAAGVGCAGPVDIPNGRTLSPPNLNGWTSFPVVDRFSEHLDTDIVFENDANAAALGEVIYGAGKGFRELVYVTLSTGIGGGLISDGRIIRGRSGNAGEVGHMVVVPNGPNCGCGARGCLESVASGTAIARRFNEAAAGGAETSAAVPAKAEDIIDAARAGDELAERIWNETIGHLAVGLGNIIVTLEPEAVILGGGLALAGPFLFEPLRAEMNRTFSIFPTDTIKLLPAALGGESGLYGAVALVREN